MIKLWVIPALIAFFLIFIALQRNGPIDYWRLFTILADNCLKLPV